MSRLLFTIFLALDGATLGLVFLLGLAAAGPSQTSVVEVIAFFLVPALVLAALAWLYRCARWRAARVAATLVAGLPVMLVLLGAAVSATAEWWFGGA